MSGEPRKDGPRQLEWAKTTLEASGLEVAAALARIDAGTFGLCCLCRDPLDTERIDSDPAVVYCADCAEERELERGQC
ncbi:MULTISPECIES: TraR/DksA family transcriptional regulator [unclassified Thiocapsa]|uniref:TraR/DksA family transcriptional regulator n=1 Tax=unclassified Thiocapsa TaxID=2641286 RepID=UPI0035AFFC21